MYFVYSMTAFYVGMISCTNFTVIYDQVFHQQMINNSLQKNDSRVNFFEIDERYDNLQNITTTIKNISKDDVVILFTKEDDFIERTLDNQQLALKYGISLANMKESNAKIQNFFCLTFNQSLQKALTMLAYSLSEPNVAIVTGEERCSKDFFVGLLALISSHQPHYQVHLSMTHVIYQKDEPPYQTNVQESSLYKLKSKDAKVIVLLVPDQYIPIVLREAFRIGVGSSSLWMIPSYHDNMAPLRWYPEKLLSFEIEEQDFIENSYRRFHRCISDVIKMFEQLSNLITRDQILTEMYRTVQRIEEERNSEKLRLNLRYRDNGAETPVSWRPVVGEIDQQWLHIRDNTIPILHLITEKASNDVIRVVTILTEPYGTERKDMYDSLHDTCTIGLKCQKSTKQNGIVSYETTCCNGFVMDLLVLVINYTGVKVNLYVVDDNKYGDVESNGEWNGMIGDLIKGKADLAAADLNFTKNRSRVVNFTLPFLESQIGIVVKSDTSTHEFINFVFISAISGQLQLTLWVVVVGIMVLHYVFENNIYFASLLTGKNVVQEKYYSAYESMSYIGGVALQRDLAGTNPKKPGVRISAVIFAFGMVIFVTTYTAMLTSHNIVHVEKNSFKGSNDSKMRNPTSEFRFGTMKNSMLESFFRDNDNDVIRKMSKFMEQYNSDTTEDGINKMMNGNLEAFIGIYELLSWSIAKHKLCEFKVQKDFMLMGAYGFAMNKEFKSSEIINQAILRIRESRELERIYTKWFAGVTACNAEGQNQSMVQRDIQHFSGLIFILCVTAVACLPMLLVEHCFNKFFRNIFLTKVKPLRNEPKSSKQCVKAKVATQERQGDFKI